MTFRPFDVSLPGRFARPLTLSLLDVSIAPWTFRPLQWTFRPLYKFYGCIVGYVSSLLCFIALPSY